MLSILGSGGIQAAQRTRRPVEKEMCLMSEGLTFFASEWMSRLECFINDVLLRGSRMRTKKDGELFSYLREIAARRLYGFHVHLCLHSGRDCCLFIRAVRNILNEVAAHFFLGKSRILH